VPTGRLTSSVVSAPRSEIWSVLRWLTGAGPAVDQLERSTPVVEAGQHLRTLSLDGLKRARGESEKVQDRGRDLGRFHRMT
jgi:hypothetical protein